MRYIDYTSLVLLISFLIAYFSKLIILKTKNNINANVLGKKNKNNSIHIVEVLVKLSSFLWAITWMTEIFLHKKIASVIGSFLSNDFLTYMGTLLNLCGIIVFLLAIAYMRSSWRVGIDKNTKSELITNGIYKFSRNPAFVGFDLMFIGLFFSYTNILTLFILGFNIVTFHLLILQEERHLALTFGEEYDKYKSLVSRYL